MKDVPVLLSPESVRVLQAIAQPVAQAARGPSLRELARAIPISNPSGARYYVRLLHASGLVSFRRSATTGRMVNRSVRLTPRGETLLQHYTAVARSPLVRGMLELVLTPRALVAAELANLPFRLYPARREGNAIILTFPRRAERDYWAAAVLECLEGPPA